MANVNKVPLKRARGSSAVKTRAHREESDRDITQDREVTDAQRVDMLRRSLFQASLPDLPKIPGFHVCWLTTQNPRDPVHGRLRLGYILLKAHDVPEFEALSLKTGDYAGCIGVNEMIAAKLPIHLYEAFMREVHFDAPLQQEEAIYTSAMDAGEQAAQAARRGGKLKGPVIESGVEEMGNMDREPPSFSDEDEQ
jgi:hypothetical protein